MSCEVLYFITWKTRVYSCGGVLLLIDEVETDRATLLLPGYDCAGQQFYSWSQDAAVTSAEKALQGVGTPLDVNVCASALHLMSQILNWEFQGTLIRGPGGILIVGKNRSNAFTSSMGRESIKRPGEHASVVQVIPRFPSRSFRSTSD